MKLTEKQTRFINEYLFDGNATQAAVRAGYSEKSAHSIAHDLLQDPKIRNIIQEKHLQEIREAQLSREMIIAGLKAEAVNPDNPGHTRVTAWNSLDRIFSRVEKLADEKEKLGPYSPPAIWIKQVIEPNRNGEIVPLFDDDGNPVTETEWKLANPRPDDDEIRQYKKDPGRDAPDYDYKTIDESKDFKLNK